MSSRSENEYYYYRRKAEEAAMTYSQYRRKAEQLAEEYRQYRRKLEELTYECKRKSNELEELDLEVAKAKKELTEVKSQLRREESKCDDVISQRKHEEEKVRVLQKTANQLRVQNIDTHKQLNQSGYSLNGIDAKVFAKVSDFVENISSRNQIIDQIINQLNQEKYNQAFAKGILTGEPVLIAIRCGAKVLQK